MSSGIYCCHCVPVLYSVCVCVCVHVKHHTNKAKTHIHRNQGERRLLKHAERAVLNSLNSEKYRTRHEQKYVDTWTLYPTTLNPGTWLQRFLPISHYRGQCSFHRCEGNIGEMFPPRFKSIICFKRGEKGASTKKC